MTEQTASPPTFPRAGEIHFHDTHIAIWEDIPDGVNRETVFVGVQAAFARLLDGLRARGFTVEPDRAVDKLIRRWYWVGRKGVLEFRAQTGGRQAEVMFFQNVANVENPNGGRHDFGKFQRMPRAMRLQCAVEMIHVIRGMRTMGYTFGPKSDLYEPLPRAVLRKAEGHEQEGLSPLERYNRGAWPDQRLTAWQTPEELDARPIWQGDRKDRDGTLLCNSDVRYFYDYNGRLMRGQVFYTSGNCWDVCAADGSWLGKPGNHAFFSTDRPDLLPRRQHREPQVSRVATELGKARTLRNRLLANPRAKQKIKLPPVLAWLAPLLWVSAVVAAQDRVAVLEGVLARMSRGERGYYTWSIKDRDLKASEPITFFRPMAAGYVWSVNHAGRFQESEVKGDPSYYDNEENTIAVPCDAVDALMGSDGCVANTSENRTALRKAAGQARKDRGQESLKKLRQERRRAEKAVKKNGGIRGARIDQSIVDEVA